MGVSEGLGSHGGLQVFPWGRVGRGPLQPPHELPVRRWCRREVDQQRRESLEQRGETRVLTQRSPWGVVRVGVLGQPLAQHLLPYARTLPLPLFAPSDLRGSKPGLRRTLSRSLSHEAQRG